MFEGLFLYFYAESAEARYRSAVLSPLENDLDEPATSPSYDFYVDESRSGSCTLKCAGRAVASSSLEHKDYGSARGVSSP